MFPLDFRYQRKHLYPTKMGDFDETESELIISSNRQALPQKTDAGLIVEEEKADNHPATQKKIHRDAIVAKLIERDEKKAIASIYLSNIHFFTVPFVAAVNLGEACEKQLNSNGFTDSMQLAILVTLFLLLLGNMTGAMAVRHPITCWILMCFGTYFAQQYLSTTSKRSLLGSLLPWTFTRWPNFVIFLSSLHGYFANLTVCISILYLTGMFEINWARLLVYLHPDSSSECLKEVSVTATPLAALLLPSCGQTDSFTTNLRRNYLYQLFHKPSVLMSLGLVM
jgi:hypothetical protein